jgi:Cu/Ag efflux protein CusF
MKTTKALSVSAVVLSVLCAGAISSLALAAEPLGKAPVKARVHEQEPCCSVTAINQATGVVTLKDLKTGKISQVTVTDQAKLKSLKIGQQVDRNL